MLQPDVLLLQEHIDDRALEAASFMGGHAAVGTNHGALPYVNAIVSRWPIEAQTSIVMPMPAPDPQLHRGTDRTPHGHVRVGPLRRDGRHLQPPGRRRARLRRTVGDRAGTAISDPWAMFGPRSCDTVLGMETTEGYLQIGGRRTWFRTTGERREGAPPLLMLHGGPGGCTPDDLLAATVVAEDRPVIAYDQLDCGRSERVSEPSRWTIDALVDELHAVRDALDLDEVHLWGASWGGTLATLHALRGSEAGGVRSTLLRRPAKAPEPGPGPTSARLRKRASQTTAALPVLRSGPVQALARAASHVPFLRRGVYDVLGLELVNRHVYRGLDIPVGAMVGLAGMNAAVYEALWGPSEFLAAGPLAGLDLRDRLGEIDVPVLVTSGAHELFAPDEARAIADGVPDGRWELFEDCAHCAMYEEPERYAAVLREFLREVDRRSAGHTARTASS